MIDYTQFDDYSLASQYRVMTTTTETVVSRGPLHGKNLPIEWVPNPLSDDLLNEFCREFIECRKTSKPIDKELAERFWSRFFAKVRGITNSKETV